MIYTDASMARQFVHRKGVGRMKHLEVRHLWLQDQLAKGAYTCRKIARSENPSDMLTHPPSAAEIVKFREKLGMYPMECSLGAGTLVKNILKDKPEKAAQVASILIQSMK